jgi:hypothetical protein
MALGPLFKGRETRFTDRMTVTRFMLSEQAVADQKLDATHANLDRRNHRDAPGAALAEASCTECGCWFMNQHHLYLYKYCVSALLFSVNV